MAIQKRNRGFTLIELLVVIAIIAILAAILFPVFARAKKIALLNGCLNNMKQWTTGVLMYMDDYNGRFPYCGSSKDYAHKPPITTMPGIPQPAGRGGSPTLYDAVDKYVGNAEAIRYCPATLSGGAIETWKKSVGWSYWYLCAHNNPWTSKYPDSALCGYAMSDVKNPSAKPVIIERDSSLHGAGGGLFTANRGYCDGHVKGWKVDQAGNTRTGYVGRDGTEPVVNN